MSRQKFGLWGIELSDDDFACALAFRGIIEAGRRHGLRESTIVEEIQRGDHELRWVIELPLDRMATEGAQLVERWKNIIATLEENRLPRLELTPQQRYFDSVDPIWLNDLLSRPATRVAALSWGLVPRQHDFTWAWPLDIGLLPHPASERLREQIRPGQWSTDFVSLVDATKDSAAACEILLIAHGARQALAEVLTAPRLAQVHTVITLGGLEGAPERLTLLDALRSQTRAEAAVAVFVPDADRGKWIEELVIELSHNRPLDVAMFAASRKCSSPTVPFIVCSRGAMDAARLSQYTHRLARDLQAAPPEATGSVPEEVLAGLNLPRTKSLRMLGAELHSGVRGFRWDRESDEASHVAKLRRAIEPVLRNTPHSHAGRHIQARVLDSAHREDNAVVTTALRINTSYVIDVRIGTDAEGWVSASEVFPEEKRPLGKRVLTVVLTEPRLCLHPQVAHIILPPEDHSDPCRFYLYTGGEEGRLDARITVLYRNRVVQTARLHASILREGPPRDEVPEEKIRLDIEAVVRPNLVSLDRRSPFDGALLLNHDDHGTPRISKFVDGRASYVEIGNLNGVIEKIGRRLAKIAVDDEVYDGLESDATKALLRDLAIDGKTLYDGLVGNDVIDQSIASGKRIQIISARADEIFPLEFCYPRPVSSTASLCNRAAACLREGKCCGEHSDDDDSVICPLAFWNLTKVIERHAHHSDYRKQVPRGVDYALQAEPVDGRNKLEIFASSVFAASEKARGVEKAPVDKLVATLSSLTGGNAEEVTTWSDWTNVIEKRFPTLLVLLSHTEVVDKHPGLEIGEADRLLPTQIMPKHVCLHSASPPVVFLMGCKTVLEEVRFENFVMPFRQKGAAIVVGTLSVVLGRHSAPTTEALIRALAEASSSSEAMSFGDILRDIRRRLVAADTPLALTIIAFGDADWRL